jgi:putative peptidoglycan lipid II flippase
MPAESSANAEVPSRARRGATHVAAGILASRLFGFARDRAIAHYFGLGPHADVFRTALRGPNLLQNLLGEGTISASFIPVYSRLLAAGRAEDAGRLAGAVFALLVAVAGGLSLLGFLAAEPIVAVLATGFLQDAASGAAVDRYELTVRAVRYMFPMTGLLVLSAWALGILNSHRRFLLSYAAPVLWNAAILGALVWTARRGVAGADELLLAACAGALAGGALQFLVQVPLVLKLVRGLEFSFARTTTGLAETLRAFGPAVLGRGALQLGGYLDLFLASFLATGAPTAMGNAQALYLLPIALLSTSVAAAALPDLSRQTTDAENLVAESEQALRRLAFLNIPAAVAYLAFGSLVVAAIYGTGSFGREESLLVYLVLAGYTLGLVAAGFSRLLQNVCFALGDTAAPARISALRVLVGAGAGLPAMLVLDQVGLDRVFGSSVSGTLRLGAVGLTCVSGAVSWLDLWLLQRSVRRRLPALRLPWGASGRILVCALLGAAPALALWTAVTDLPAIVATALVLLLYGLGFLAAARVLKVPELSLLARRRG